MENCHFCSGLLTQIGPEERCCPTCGARYAGSATVPVVQFLAATCPGCQGLSLGGELGNPLDCESCGRRWQVSWDGGLRLSPLPRSQELTE